MAKLDGSFNIALQEEMDITFGVNYQVGLILCLSEDTGSDPR